MKLPILLNPSQSKWRGKRGVGMELAIVTLLIVSALSMFIVTAALGDAKTKNFNERYTERRTALAFLGEYYVKKVTEGGQFNESEFRSRHVFFKDAYSTEEASCKQSVSASGLQTTYTMIFGMGATEYLHIEIIKTEAGETATYQVTRWEANP